MRKIALLLAAFICLQIGVLAVPDSVTTGPYTLSFDLGLPHNAYTVTTNDLIKSEDLSGVISTKYTVKIQNQTGMTRFAQIDITRKDKADALPSESDLKLIMNYAASTMKENGAINFETATRQIDGTIGGVLSLDYPVVNQYIKMYSSSYYPSKDSGYTNVVVSSAYPWDEGTLQLFRTVHVEYMGSATDINPDVKSIPEPKEADLSQK